MHISTFARTFLALLFLGSPAAAEWASSSGDQGEGQVCSAGTTSDSSADRISLLASEGLYSMTLSRPGWGLDPDSPAAPVEVYVDGRRAGSIVPFYGFDDDLVFELDPETKHHLKSGQTIEFHFGHAPSMVFDLTGSSNALSQMAACAGF